MVGWTVAVMTVVLALGVGIGAALGESSPTTRILGTAVLGLYAAALAGVGLAVGGLVRTSIAGEAVAVVVVATFLIDLVAPALKLPDWFHGLALTDHLGPPTMGAGTGAASRRVWCSPSGGLALSGWGMSRRDVAK